jgi:pimeloyl-ACP methyl ester carboxylesterase
VAVTNTTLRQALTHHAWPDASMTAGSFPTDPSGQPRGDPARSGCTSTARSGGGNISLTTEPPAEARLADATAPALVARGEQNPDFPDPRAEADWIGQALRGQVVIVSEAGHYPQSQRPGLTAAAILRFLETVKGRA